MTIRKRFIIDMVEKWKKDYPEEYAEWLYFIGWKRSVMKDSFLGKTNGEKELRNAVSIPDRVSKPLFFVLNGVAEERFLEPKGEMKWFIKKFPEFLITKSY